MARRARRTEPKERGAPADPVTTRKLELSSAIAPFPQRFAEYEQAVAAFLSDGPIEERRDTARGLARKFLLRSLAARNFHEDWLEAIGFDLESEVSRIIGFFESNLGEGATAKSREYVLEMEDFFTSISAFQVQTAKFQFDEWIYTNSLYSRLLKRSRYKLERLLKDEGISEADSSRFIDAAFRDFESSGKIPKDGAELVFQFALSTLRASGELPRASFKRSASKSSPRWVDRKSAKFPTAESFLQRHYKGRLGIDGDLTLTQLKRLDRDLFEQIQLEFTSRPEELAALLPTPTQRADAKLLRALGFVPTDPRQRQHFLSVISRGGQPGARGSYRPKQA